MEQHTSKFKAGMKLAKVGKDTNTLLSKASNGIIPEENSKGTGRLERDVYKWSFVPSDYAQPSIQLN